MGNDQEDQPLISKPSDTIWTFWTKWMILILILLRPKQKLSMKGLKKIQKKIRRKFKKKISKIFQKKFQKKFQKNSKFCIWNQKKNSSILKNQWFLKPNQHSILKKQWFQKPNQHSILNQISKSQNSQKILKNS